MKDFADSLIKLIELTTLFPGEDLFFEVVLNPAAGFLRDKRKIESLLASMNEMIGLHEKESQRDRRVKINLHEPRDREESLLAILESVGKLAANKPHRSLLLLAGGDGFHKDAGTAIMLKDPALFNDFILFRLPLGTGNDTPLVTDPIKALNFLFTEGEVIKDSVIRVTARERDTDYAFNVASFGLDAYVCLLTERWKGQVKGDIYKIMVDLSSLFYDLYHRTRKSEITLFLNNEEKPLRIRKRVLLNVFGRKGHTTYGGGIKILPGNENHMITGMFQIPGRIMLKGLFIEGKHGKRKMGRVDFYNTKKSVLNYPVPLLMELDGELTHLGRDNFPVTLELIPHILSVIN